MYLKIHFNYLSITATYNFSENFRTMKLIKYFFFLPASVVLLLLACNNTTTNPLQSGNWVTRSESPANARFQAVSFTIGDTAYVGTGYDGSIRYNDLWSFNISNSWQQKAYMPSSGADSAPARNGAVAFAVGKIGYITTGTDGYNKFSDTWAYNVASNSWSRKANFAAGSSPVVTGRYGATAFAIGDYGYVTCGYDNEYKKDLWRYDPSNDSWAAMAPLGTTSTTPPTTSGGPVYSNAGFKRMMAISFVHTDKASGKTLGYVVTGLGSGGTNINDFWAYDPTTNLWKGLKVISNASTQNYDDDYSDIIRNSGVGFVMGDSAYISAGVNGGYTQKTWAYDFNNDLWSRKSNFERSGREGGVAFVINGRGFVSLGKAGGTYFDDLEEFQPYTALNTDD